MQFKILGFHADGFAQIVRKETYAYIHIQGNASQWMNFKSYKALVWFYFNSMLEHTISNIHGIFCFNLPLSSIKVLVEVEL